MAHIALRKIFPVQFPGTTFCLVRVRDGAVMVPIARSLRTIDLKAPARGHQKALKRERRW
jgi:hypothetical protein